MFTKKEIFHTVQTIGFGTNSGSIKNYGNHPGVAKGCPRCHQIGVGLYRVVTQDMVITKPNWPAILIAGLAGGSMVFGLLLW